MSVGAVSGRMNDRYCGYVDEVHAVADLGPVCCVRPTWEGGRCVWHADAEAKPVADLAALRPVPGERLDGAILRSVSIPDADWFAGCVLVRARASTRPRSTAPTSRAPTSDGRGSGTPT